MGMRYALGLGLALALAFLGGCGLFSQPPVAIIQAEPPVGRPPLTVHFDGGRSFDPDGTITLYRWDFGDGTTATGVKVSHTYTSPGFYQVTLTVRDNAGKRARDSLIVRNFGFSRRDIPVGERPVFALSADFDRDGVQDLFVLNRFADEGAVLLGNGDGSFRMQKLKLSDGPTAAVAADFDHDGLLDLVVANLIDNTVSVLLGNGDGSFKRFQDFQVGSGPLALTAVDLDHDGNLDLAVVNDFSDEVLLLWGDGMGHFTKGNALKSELLENIKSVDWGDFDRDGNPDLAVLAADSANVGIFLGNGEGDFHGPWLFDVAPNGRVIRRADLDGDGKDDLVVAAPTALEVLHGWGAGEQTFKPAEVIAQGTELAWVAVTDLDDDGVLDLLAADTASAEVLLLIGLGEGEGEGEEEFAPPVRFATGAGPTTALAVDLNGDGLPDLVTTDRDEDEITVLLNITAY